MLFQMRLENVFLRVRPIVLSLARSTMFSSTTLFSNNRNVQRARPLGGSEQAKAISLASFSPSKNSGNGRRRSWLATQHSLEAFFHQLFADPVNHGCAGLQGLDDLVVAPSFAGFRGVRLQQNPRLHQPLRRAASFPGQCRKLLTFLAAQPHNIFLYDNFPCSHDRLRRSVATKANHQILSNWLKRTTRWFRLACHKPRLASLDHRSPQDARLPSTGSAGRHDRKAYKTALSTLRQSASSFEARDLTGEFGTNSGRFRILYLAAAFMNEFGSSCIIQKEITTGAAEPQLPTLCHAVEIPNCRWGAQQRRNFPKKRPARRPASLLLAE